MSMEDTEPIDLPNWCPGCLLEGPAGHFNTKWCWRHAPAERGLSDPEPVPENWFAIDKDWAGMNRRWCAFLHRGIIDNRRKK